MIKSTRIGTAESLNRILREQNLRLDDARARRWTGVAWGPQFPKSATDMAIFLRQRNVLYQVQTMETSGAE